jgi:hypothetical protein
MLNELVFTVDHAKPTRATRITLGDAGLRERNHLQEWVLADPHILGEDTMVVTSEFASWAGAGGAKDEDRLDVLGLLNDGRLVVAELKRGAAPHSAHMQALNYAARASLFDTEELTKAYRAFRKSRGETLSAEEAGERLRAHAPQLSDETLKDSPRIVLVATDFDRNLTTTAAFLIRHELEIQFVRVQAYRTTGGEVLITASRVFPPEEMEALLLAPSVKEQEERMDRARQRAKVKEIVEAGILADGTPMRLDPDVSKATNAKIRAWVAADPSRGRATWSNNPSAPLRWEADGRQYSPSALVGHIVIVVTGESQSVQGTKSWRDPQGRTLVELADALPAAQPAS